MRVTQGQISRMVYLGTQNNLGNMARLQEMTTTGRRINSYADDPRGAGLVRHYESLLTQNDQYLRNINRSRTMVESTDLALQDMLELVRNASTVARREASGASSNWQTRNVGASEVEGLINEAMTILNQTVEGNALFGGYRTDLEPFVKSSTGEVLYQGDTNEMIVSISPNTDMVVNVPGSELLGSDLSVLGGFGDLSPRLAASTALTEIALGEGWNMGGIAFTGSTGVEQTVDLSGAGTVGDVIDILADAGLTAVISADGRNLEITDPGGGPLTIRNADETGTAQSLGIVGSSTGGTVFGSDIRAEPRWSTNLAAIDSMASALPLGSIHLEMNGTDLDIDLSGSATLDDVRTAFETAVAGAGLPALRMDLDGAALNIVSDTGESFAVTAIIGDGTADALGIAGSGSPARLFGTLESLADALRADDKDAMRAYIGELEAIEQQILKLEIATGGRESMLEWTEGLLTDRDIRLNSNLSNVRDADVIEVASKLTQAETAYQASLLVSSKVMSMNLFDFL
jgi:flagellar hook-associated protein 3 FlgL